MGMLFEYTPTLPSSICFNSTAGALRLSFYGFLRPKIDSCCCLILHLLKCVKRVHFVLVTNVVAFVMTALTVVL